MGAGDITAVNRLCPVNRISDHTNDIRMIVDREGFVPGLEIENASVSTAPATAGAENFTAIIVADENQFFRIRDAEGLAIGFYMLQMNKAVNSLSNGMCRIADPDQLPVAVLAPRKIARGTHQQLERLAVMCGMQKDCAHTTMNSPLYKNRHLVRNEVVRNMSPPD